MSNVIPFPTVNTTIDDDEIIRNADAKIAQWLAEGQPSLTTVQEELFHEAICAGASAMVRDKIVEAIISAFGNDLGGRRAMTATWNAIAKDHASELAQEARENIAEPELTPEQKAILRESLWPSVRELAEAPDLVERMITQVHRMGVVGERELIVLVYIAGTSRVLANPINIIIKGGSGGGKSFTAEHALELIGPDYVSRLTTSSALSLVYDTRPLSHRVLFLFEASQLQAAEKQGSDSTFALLLRSLMSEGKLKHQVSVEDANAQFGRRVELIEREGPISFIVSTTTGLYDENETRILQWYIHEDPEQTAAVIQGIAASAAGTVIPPSDLANWHDLQRWISLGSNQVIVPFAPQIAKEIRPLMVRFRRDAGALFNFIKASAILHQAQRRVDEKGRIIATVADYALAHPIFCQSMAEVSGRTVTDNVRAVVKLIAERTKALKPTPEKMRFKRVEVAGQSEEVTLSSEQIGTALGVGKWAACRAINSAIDLGLLANNETRPRKPFRLIVKHDVDEVGASLLPNPKTISEGGAA